jgi:hypothetical protein
VLAEYGSAQAAAGGGGLAPVLNVFVAGLLLEALHLRPRRGRAAASERGAAPVVSETVISVRPRGAGGRPLDNLRGIVDSA